jgi:hypothetical protein
MVQNTNEQYGPPQSEVLHSWPDGWTVQHHTRQEDINRVGQMMANCLQRWPKGAGPITSYVGLHDPQGRPKWVADIDKNGQIGIPLGPWNAYPWDSNRGKNQVRRLEEWAQSAGHTQWNAFSPTGMPHPIAFGAKNFNEHPEGYDVQQALRDHYGKFKQASGEWGPNLWWNPGDAGRGFIQKSDGTVHHWPESMGAHLEMSTVKNVPWEDVRTTSFWLRPDGTATFPYLPENEQHLDPLLRQQLKDVDQRTQPIPYGPEGANWQGN